MRVTNPLSLLRRKARLTAAYDSVWQSPDGRMVIEDLLKKAGLFETALVMGDGAATAWRDGRRSMGLEIIEALRWNEAELIRLAREQTAERVSDPELNVGAW